MSDRIRRAVAAASVLLIGVLALALSGCIAEPGDLPTRGPAAPTNGSPTPVESERPQTATPTPTAVVATIPDDCRTMVSAAVLAQFGETPLNDPSVGSTGLQPDGSLVCVWRDPRADTTSLATTISEMSRGPALDMLNALVASDGFTCYTPDKGTRCEKTWDDPTYPVTDGRTLFWRDGILIDTVYSNLAPSGYTDSVIAHVFG
jgi:hypothetical protein